MKQTLTRIFIGLTLLALTFGAIGITPAYAAISTLPSANLSTTDWAQIKSLLPVLPATQQAYLKASNADAGDQFGYTTAIYGDTLVVGAPYESSSASGGEGDNSANSSGAVYVFTRSGTSWSQQAYLKASNANGGDAFGVSVAISEDTLVVGATGESSNASGGESDNSASCSGAAYVFTRSGTSWSQQAYLKASNTETVDFFGASVDISGDTLVVGAPGEDSSTSGDESDNSASNSGAAYVFTRSGTSWSQQAYLKASNAETLDNLGRTSIGIFGDTVVVGAYWEDSSASGGESDNSTFNSGAVYVFTRSGTSWSQQAYLKASNADSNDEFGWSADIFRDTLVVGSFNEDSSANGSESDNSVFGSGAVYVYTRSGTSWSQQAFLKASNAEAGDVFGMSVSIFEDMLVVGATGEDSSASSGESDNSSLEAGAAYVFTRSGTSWSQQAYLKASNADAYDRFGVVAISGDTLVVGAFDEDRNASGEDSNNVGANFGAAYVFVVSDTIAPAAPVIIAPADGSSTNDSTPNVNGTAEVNSTVSVFIDGSLVGTTKANSVGNWLWTASTLSDGSHNVKATATDAANNTSLDSNINTFTVDTTAPAAPVVSAPANHSTTNSTTPNVIGTAEANSGINVFIDDLLVGTTKANNVGNWQWTASPLSDGAHTVKATATDAMKNTSVDSNINTFAINADLIYNQSYLIQYDTWVGSRHNEKSFGGGYRHATSGIVTFRAPVAFTKITWLTYRGPDQGKAQVFVDGVLKTTVDLYSASGKWQSPVVISGLTNTKHVVIIKAGNAKNAASSGKWVMVDGFKIGTTSYDDNRIDIDRLYSYGSWLNSRSPSARFRGYAVSIVANATATFTYTGAAFDWVTARGPAYGKAAVYVDGVLIKTVDLYNASQQWQYHVAFPGVSYGTHKVVIKVLGTKNTNSTGKGVVSDGFEIAVVN